MNENLYSIEMEQSVLCIFMTNYGTGEHIEELVVNDFYATRHQIIFEKIKALHLDGKGHDVEVIADHIRKVNINGLTDEYLMEVYSKSIGSAHRIADYIEKLKEYTRRRALFNAGEQIKTIASDITQYDIINAVAQSESVLAQLETNEESTTLDSAFNVSVDLFKSIDDRMQLRAQGKEEFNGVKTGLTDLDKQIGVIQNTDLVVIGARPSMGKELHNDSKVYMLDGTFKRIGDVVIGDRVASIDGKESFVLGVFPQGKKDTYKVTFSDGRSVLAGIDHQWEVGYKGWSKSKVLNTKDIISLLGKPHLKNRLTIPLCGGDFGLDSDLSIDPYLLGVLLGDGGFSSGGVRLSNGDQEIVSKCSMLVGELSLTSNDGLNYNIVGKKGHSNWLKDELNRFGLLGLKSHEKFIPINYLSATKESRLKLIRGLIDTDGTVEKTGTIRYTTTSKKLSDDFVLLARSLGCWAKTSSRVTQFTYKGEKKSGKQSYTTTLNHKDLHSFVSLERKKERLSNNKNRRTMNLTFSSIEKVGFDECTCITVSHDRELFLTEDYIVTHNTAFAQTLMLDISFLQQKPVLFQSAEMSKTQIGSRLVAALGDINLSYLTGANVPQKHWTDFNKATQMLQKAKLMIDDKQSPSLQDIRKNCRRLKNQYGYVGAVFVDYLTLMKSPIQTDNMHQSTGALTKGLKGIAKEFNCPVFCLAQLSRKLEERKDKRPMNSDLRESGSIEEDANIVLFLYRDEYYNKQSQEAGTCEVIATKVRDGVVGTVRVATELQYSRFSDLAHYGED